MKKTYFVSDAHLGSLFFKNSLEREKKLVRWLDSIKDEAQAIYLLGDLFDFWYEHKMVVPKGHTRLLGKLSELTDSGVEIHFFVGNHDLWCNDYFQKECGLILHRKPFVTQINGNWFYLAHGDGLGSETFFFGLLRKIFHSKILQICFSAIHPRWSIALGLNQSQKSRKRQLGGKEPDYMGEKREGLVLFAKSMLVKDPKINYFVFGHRHIMLDLMLNKSSRIAIIGDWIRFFSFAVFDEDGFYLDQFEEMDQH